MSAYWEGTIDLSDPDTRLRLFGKVGGSHLLALTFIGENNKIAHAHLHVEHKGPNSVRLTLCGTNTDTRAERTISTHAAADDDVLASWRAQPDPTKPRETPRRLQEDNSNAHESTHRAALIERATKQLMDELSVDEGQLGEGLDEAVHDAKAGEAADINNSGAEEQIEYLAGHLKTVEEIVAEIKRQFSPMDGED